MMTQGRTIYLDVARDTPLKDIIGIGGEYSSRRYKRIGESGKNYLLEILPYVELDIRIIKWWKD